MIVVDASALIDVLVGAASATGRLADEELAAPHLLDAEVASVLRRQTLAGQMEPDQARSALDDLADLEIGRYSHGSLLDRAWQLRANVTVYDALYVALAEVLDVPLVTLDARLAASPGVRARIEVFPSRATPGSDLD